MSLPIPAPAPARGPTLRLVCINDVYTLENLPRLRTLVQEQARVDPADLLLTILAGDFVGPSMLSSLDFGRGMVDCLNAVPITLVVLGNHEADIPVAELRARIAEFRGTWLSTNVIGLDPKLLPSRILDVGHAGSRRVRVGLVGVVMDDPAVYCAGPFGGATLLPANETALRAAAHLVDVEGCACVIPVTHQPMDADRALARATQSPRAPRFPVIVGGHEHVVDIEEIAGTWLEKAGADARHAVIVDLTWPAAAPAAGQPDLPAVRVRLEEVARHAEDTALRARVEGHMRAVVALQQATLLHLAPGEALSSVGARAQQTTLGALLCARLRDALGADGAIMNGGAIRAARAYEKHFTYGDLEAEVPFENEVVVASLPGRVLREAIAASRAHAPLESGGYLQVDAGLVVGADQQLVRVNGAPLDDARDYRIALVRNLFEGLDHIEPLVRFATESPARVPPMGSGRDIKVALVNAFSRALWDQFGTFDSIDTDHDGVVDAREIAEAITRVTAEPASPITVELLLKAIDADHDHRISRAEAEAARVKPS
ncbi:MAG: 5'-nucleotidase C-terminal domain-containing protein [Byssovorax sp.]